MKQNIFVLCLMLIVGCSQQPCPIHGSAKPGTLQYTLNPKKNRTDIPFKYLNITVTDFLALPDDSIGDGTAYCMTGGYVIKVKRMNAESCNCKNPDEVDYHIVVVPSPDDENDISKHVVVEVTPRLRKQLHWKESEIKHLENHWVDFFGYKFADLEHQDMSTKSNPTNKKCWRGTINEIHPVTAWLVVN